MNALTLFAELEVDTAEVLLKPYTPPRSPDSPVYEQILLDVDFLSERFRRLQRPLGQSDSMEASRDEIAEMLISSAATASLVGYRRPGDRWRLEVVEEDSKRGRDIVAHLDALRAELSAADRYVRRVMQDARIHPSLKRSVALCALALDAVSAFQIPTYACFAGIQPASRDVSGDAQCIAEEHDYAGTLPLAQNA